MNSISKIRVYTNGLAIENTGAYAYIVLESQGANVNIAGAEAAMFAPSVLKAKFAQGGKCSSPDRMMMRAVYEGVRHCPNGSSPEVYLENFLVPSMLEVAKAGEEDGDIAVKYRQYIAANRITPQFIIAKHYNGKDLPDNDHDEWTWWAHHLCEDAIKRFNKENKQ